MIQLKLADIEDVKPFLSDFVTRAKEASELDGTQCLFTICDDSTPIGYFALSRNNKTLEIEHGYLVPSAQHKGIPAKAMQLVEELARNVGCETVALATVRDYAAYTKFMSRLGYTRDYTVYSKRI